MTVNELIKELKRVKKDGFGNEEVVYLDGEYRHNYRDIYHLHIGRRDRGSNRSIVINGSEYD